MKIKFLSFIASFFMVSFVITSCLDDDNNIEYSPDATIHAFSLDTIGYGKTYKFTIDQQKGEIYNEDSLPVHADTIIDKILIKTLTTVSGVVTMKDKNDKDSIININDSIDLRESLKIKVWSTEALAGISSGKTKDYTISVRIHKHDPDSLNWNYVGEISNSITEKQKSVFFNNQVYTYSSKGNELKVYTSHDFSNWTSETVTGLNKLPNSIMPLKKMILATADNQVYSSTNGINWTVFDKLSGNVTTLVSQLPENKSNDTQITYIKKEGEKRYLYSVLESQLNASAIQETQWGETDNRFPVDHISYATFKKGDLYQNVIVGKHEPNITTTIGNKEIPVMVTWGYNGTTWAEIGTTSSTGYCPAFENPTIIYYNEMLYVWGDKFESIYVSESEGFAWKKAGNKFSFPNYDWTQSTSTPPATATLKPEFRGRSKYSVIQDTKNQYIYILFGQADHVTFEETIVTKDEENDSKATTVVTRTYSHKAEVWRGRLNQLWFDLDSEHAGQ